MFGSEGAEVAKLQYQLSVLGYFEGCTTGFFGEKTEVSVIQFQSDWGLVVDGVVGPQTYEILFRPDRGDPSPAETSGGGATIVDNPNTLEIQSHLQALGYYQGSIDGIYGPLTARAVGDFQADRGLVVDGIAGSQTMAALGQGESEGTGQGSTAIPLEDIIVLPPPPPPAWL
jgi:peptidoglycan hydrolase-like protein with peptidoglycan-binding domain